MPAQTPVPTAAATAAAAALKTATLTPKKHIRNAFQNSSDARTTITTFQRDNSLHCMFAKAFGTRPIHENNNSNNTNTVEEPLDPSPVLEFLSHLNVTRHEVHSRVAAALRSAIEDEIQRMPLSNTANPSSSSSGDNASQHAPLLNLLKSVWQFRDVPELRPILVCLLKRLGEHTPVQMLRRLAAKNEVVEKDGDCKGGGGLKNAELLSQLGPHLLRLVWEANYDERLEAVTARYAGQNAVLSGPIEKELTLKGPTILADLVGPSVQMYLNDPILVQAADLSFVASTSERRCNTKARRMKAIESGHVGGSVGALSLIGGVKQSEEKEKTSPKDDKSVRASAEAISSIKDIIGSRPKLLGAVLNMLISEYASNGSGQARILTMSSDEKLAALKDGSNSTMLTILGGSTNLSCSLVSDILLSFGQLPRTYEVLGIMARILDAAVQAGTISDIAIVQVQGCLRSIFRPEQSDQASLSPSKSPTRATDQESGGPKIKLKLKSANQTSTFPDLPPDDSEYTKKIVQRVVKTAIAKLKTNDYQGLFLNPVTDAIAPGYSLIIAEPMCIRTMEEKMMASKYNAIEEFKNDTMTMFNNCVKYNEGPNGTWFVDEANRQKELWKTIYVESRNKFKAEIEKRRRVLKQAASAEQHSSSNSGAKKRKPPPPLAFGLSDKSAKTGPAGGNAAKVKEANDDAAINKLTANDVDPLPRWNKRRKTESDSNIPNMQCIAAMLLADPFVMRIILDKVLRIIRSDVKAKNLHSSLLLPSIIQMINIAKISVPLCAVKGKKYLIPDSGMSLINGTDESVPFQSIRRLLPVFSKMLLDVEIDRRMTGNGDLHDVSSAGLLTHPELQKKAWEGSSSQHDMKVIVQGALVNLLLPGNTNEMALNHQFPRFVAALDGLSGGNMLHEKPFYVSMTTALLRYKSKLPHSTRDLVTKCMLAWLRMGNDISAEARICSCLHEALINLLNEWSLRGNLVLPRDLFLTLAEEAVAATDNKEIGQRNELFAKLWKQDDAKFASVKEQYQKMLSSTPEAKAVAWREKVGVEETSGINAAMEEETNA